MEAALDTGRMSIESSSFSTGDFFMFLVDSEILMRKVVLNCSLIFNIPISVFSMEGDTYSLNNRTKQRQSRTTGRNKQV
jgi:hypothetical protein